MCIRDRFQPAFELIEKKYNEKITLSKLANTVGLSAVSYTHLDVYKRQEDN